MDDESVARLTKSRQEFILSKMSFFPLPILWNRKEGMDDIIIAPENEAVMR
jgi:hypothetical protein